MTTPFPEQSDLNRVEYYVIPDGRNKGIHVMYGRWPVNTLAHRGLIGRRYYYRPATAPELAVQKPPHTRYSKARYLSLETLIKDEIELVGESHAECIMAALEKVCLSHGLSGRKIGAGRCLWESTACQPTFPKPGNQNPPASQLRHQIHTIPNPP